MSSKCDHEALKMALEATSEAFQQSPTVWEMLRQLILNLWEASHSQNDSRGHLWEASQLSKWLSRPPKTAPQELAESCGPLLKRNHLGHLPR